MPKKIAYTKPSITELEKEYAADAVANGWGEKCYDYINRFEHAFAEYLGVKHVISTSSCTGAYHMGLAGLGISQSDEVIVADTNWIATISPIVHLGGKPVFVDINSDSWCIEPQLVEQAITPRTKAIVVTHLYGGVGDMRALQEIGGRHGIPVIEDAAQAIGSKYFGERAGSIGEFGVFSFHGTKTLTTGEGGAFVTNDTALYEKVLTLSNSGRKAGQIREFWPVEFGYKFKMPNVNAAIGCAQLERVEELVGRKRQILKYYKTRLLKLPDVSMNYEDENILNSAWMPTVVFGPQTNITRDQLQKAFLEEGIDARVFFWPISSLPMFGGKAVGENSKSIASRAINLPSFYDMTEDEMDRVCSIVERLY